MAYSQPKTIPDLIDSYCFSTEISNEAKQYYLEEHKRIAAKKSEGHKKNLAFFCVFQAHLLLRQPFSPYQLAKLMNIERKKIGKILTKYILFGFEATIIRYSADDFLSLYSEYAGLPLDKLPSLYKISKRIYENDPTLNDASPQRIAAAIVNYFHEMNGHPYDHASFLKRVETTGPSLQSYTNRVRSADNKGRAS